MNYTIIGNDGKKYGPVNAEQIRTWITQNRVESRTLVFVEGANDWTFVGLLPEFAGAFSGTPPALKSLKPGAPPVSSTNSLAVAGLVCGILSWTLCCCCLPFNLVGLVLSIIALVQINAHPATQEGRGLAIAGLILSATNLLWSFGLTLLSLATNPNQFQYHFSIN